MGDQLPNRLHGLRWWGYPRDRSLRRQLGKRRQEQLWGPLWKPLQAQIEVLEDLLTDQLNEDWNSERLYD